MNEFISKWCLRWARQTQSGTRCVGQLEGASAFDDGGGQLEGGSTSSGGWYNWLHEMYENGLKSLKPIQIPSLFEDLSK